MNGTTSHIFMQGIKDRPSSYPYLTGRFFPVVFRTQKHKLLQAWIELHKDELMADWELAVSGEQPYKIDPLR